MLETIAETIALYREKEGHPFKDCELKNDHSKLGNKHETNHAFSRAVDKIQNKKENELTNQEKESCKGLLKKNHLNWAGIDNQDEDDDDLSSKEELQTQDSATFSLKSIYSQASKKAEEEERKGESEYIDCSFIGASAGIVERLWSKFDALVDQRRNGMSPVMIVIEAILYLKENRDLWDISDVKTALTKLRENEKTARFEERWAALSQEQDRIMTDMEALYPTGNDE